MKGKTMKDKIKTNTYFTADWHIKNISDSKIIIDNFNNIIHKDDIVFFLGDITHELQPEETNNIINNLVSCRKILVRGNHDHKPKHCNCWDDVVRYEEIVLGDKPENYEKLTNDEKLKVDYYKFSLSHYPQISWRGMNSGSYHLHGHIHSTGDWNNCMHKLGLRQYDVGVYANNYKPVSITQIINFFQFAKINPIHGLEEKLLKEHV